MTKLQESLRTNKLKLKQIEEKIAKYSKTQLDREVNNELLTKLYSARTEAQLQVNLSSFKIEKAQPKQVYVNYNKKTVTVKFDNGEAETVTCAEEDTFNIEVGISTAIATYKMGGKSIYHRYMERLCNKVICQ